MKTKNLVCLDSYQSAISFIKYSKQLRDSFIIVGSDLHLFKRFFSKFTGCLIMSKTWRKKDFWSVLEKNSPVNVTFWGYALSELGLSTVEFARKYKILINIILPSAVADDLYYSSKLNLIVCLKNIKSFAKILLKKAFGSPIKVKTYNNYLYDCIGLVS